MSLLFDYLLCLLSFINLIHLLAYSIYSGFISIPRYSILLISAAIHSDPDPAKGIRILPLSLLISLLKFILEKINFSANWIGFCVGWIIKLWFSWFFFHLKDTNFYYSLYT